MSIEFDNTMKGHAARTILEANHPLTLEEIFPNNGNICGKKFNSSLMILFQMGQWMYVSVRLSRIKEILWNKYHRRTVPSSRGLESGMRATTDSDDLAGTAYLRQNRRIANGIKAAAETREKIDIDEMHNENLKSMVQRTDPIIKKFMMADLMKKLELPAPSDD